MINLCIVAGQVSRQNVSAAIGTAVLLFLRQFIHLQSLSTDDVVGILFHKLG